MAATPPRQLWCQRREHRWELTNSEFLKLILFRCLDNVVRKRGFLWESSTQFPFAKIRRFASWRSGTPSIRALANEVCFNFRDVCITPLKTKIFPHFCFPFFWLFGLSRGRSLRDSQSFSVSRIDKLRSDSNRSSLQSLRRSTVKIYFLFICDFFT